jgi:hypothetical protein
MATDSLSPVPRLASEDARQPPAAVKTENGVEASPPSLVERSRQVDATPVGAAAADTPLPIETTPNIATPDSTAPRRVLAYHNEAPLHPELAASFYYSSHTIANDPSYPSDVRQNPVLNHRGNALTYGGTAVRPTSLNSAPRTASSKPTSGHKRGISSVADFAYPAGDPRETMRSASEEEELAQFRRDANNTSLRSQQTTAVNTTRNSSDSSADEIAFADLAGEMDPDLYENLRRLIAAAQPGVTFTINVYNRNRPDRPPEVDMPHEAMEQEVRPPRGWEHWYKKVRPVWMFM